MQIGIVRARRCWRSSGSRWAWGVVRRTPLDGALALFFGVCAAQHAGERSPARSRRVARGRCGSSSRTSSSSGGCATSDHGGPVRPLARGGGGRRRGRYGIVQHFTGADWYRARCSDGRRAVRPRLAGARRLRRGRLLPATTSRTPTRMIFPLAWAGAFARAARVDRHRSPRRCLTLAIVFSTARGVWIATLAMAVGAARDGGAGAARRRRAGRRGVGALAVAMSPGLREQVVPAVHDAAATTPAASASTRPTSTSSTTIRCSALGFGRYQTGGAPVLRPRIPDADRRSHAHNNFLQIAAEAGLVGLAAFCARVRDRAAARLRGGRGAPRPGQWATTRRRRGSGSSTLPRRRGSRSTASATPRW